MATMATKEQERKALEKIRKIVEELGEGSYVGIALEGCLEMAKENIDNDWGLSEKQLADAAAKKVEELEKEVEDLKGRLDRERSERAEDAKAAEAIIEATKKKTLSPDDICDFSQLLADKVMELGKEVAAEADKIVSWASEPDADIFKQAVQNHRAADTSLRYYTALLERVNTVKNKLA